MSSLLQRGVSWLAGKLTDTAIAGESVTYTRPSTGQSATLDVTFGKTMLKLADGLGGNRIEWTDSDCLIRAATLILGGAATEPERGDTITRTSGGVTVTYEVRPYDKDEPCWRWADESRILMRTHLKEIAAA